MIISTGNSACDKLLGGGYGPGLHMVYGARGSGKTRWLAHVSSRFPASPVVMVTATPQSKVFEQARQAGGGAMTRPVYHLVNDVAGLENALRWSNQPVLCEEFRSLMLTSTADQLLKDYALVNQVPVIASVTGPTAQLSSQRTSTVFHWQNTDLECVIQPTGIFASVTCLRNTRQLPDIDRDPCASPAPAKLESKCECGAYKTYGAAPGASLHSSWCSWRKS